MTQCALWTTHADLLCGRFILNHHYSGGHITILVLLSMFHMTKHSSNKYVLLAVIHVSGVHLTPFFFFTNNKNLGVFNN